jgi:hypothetical protein
VTAGADGVAAAAATAVVGSVDVSSAFLRVAGVTVPHVDVSKPPEWLSVTLGPEPAVLVTSDVDVLGDGDSTLAGLDTGSGVGVVSVASDVSAAACVVDGGSDDGASEVVESVDVSSAHATPGVLATAAPMPSATANAPTRPMYLLLPMADSS